MWIKQWRSLKKERARLLRTQRSIRIKNVSILFKEGMIKLLETMRAEMKIRLGLIRSITMKILEAKDT